MASQQTRESLSELPLGAPARHVKLDFGSPAIQTSAAPCRILDSEPKLMRRSLVDTDGRGTPPA